MPQIWMTHGELAALLDCSVADARAHAIHLSLDRKRSRDGFTRVKLNMALTVAFVARIRESDFDIDGAIEQLRKTHAEMSRTLAGAGVAGVRSAERGG